MKEIQEVNALVIDYGTFPELARCLSKQCAQVGYYSPFETEYRDIKQCCIGTGITGVERVDEFMDRLNEWDLFVFPDIGYGGLQRYLKSIGKAVWGSMGASYLELYRTHFLDVIGKLGLAVAPSVRLRGVTALTAYLKEHNGQWVKINRYRGNFETCWHEDYAHSRGWLNALEMEFGGLCEKPVFVVQEPIDDAQEIGYDGFCVDGMFPSQSYQGYELKNECYSGSLMAEEDQPEEVREVNKAMAPVLESYGYRNFWATELRVKDGTAYFIDPTPRQAGQTMEHQYLSCVNLPSVIWKGANDIMEQPEFNAPFAVEATLHHKDNPEAWKVLRVPEEARDHCMLYRFCEADGLFHFPPAKNNEVGVVVGLGDSVEAAIDDLKEYFELLKDEPVTIELAGFAKLIEQIEEAEESGMEFGDSNLPEPAAVISS